MSEKLRDLLLAADRLAREIVERDAAGERGCACEVCRQIIQKLPSADAMSLIKHPAKRPDQG